MKFFVYTLFLFGLQAKSLESVDSQRYLKNIESKGNETVAQYIERNKDVLPKKIYQQWTSNPDIGKLEMLPIEVNVVQGKPIFYLRDAKNRQHTLAFKGERNNLFSFDGVSISGAEFVDFNAAIKKIAGRDYIIRQMIEKPDPQAWPHLFQKMRLPKISQLKTKDKTKFLVYHRGLLLFWLQAREVLSLKQQKQTASLDLNPQLESLSPNPTQDQGQNFNSKFFAALTELFIEQAIAADASGVSSTRDGDRCVERGYSGVFRNNECKVTDEVTCAVKTERSCNSNVYSKLNGQVKCVPVGGGDKACGADILKSMEASKLQAADFSQPSLINTPQMVQMIGEVDAQQAKAFALSFLKTTGNPNLAQLDEAYKVFNTEIEKAFGACEVEYKKATNVPADAKLRESCMMLKKQQVLFLAGLKAVNDPKNPYVWATEQRESCDNAMGYPDCGEPAAAGAAVCYKGVIKCSATGFAVGVGGTALVAALMSGGNKGSSKATTTQDPVWDWPPKNACDDLTSPMRMWCSDPDKCPLPYQMVAPAGTTDTKLADYAKATGYCRPPPCSGNSKTKTAAEPLTNFVWSYASNGCVDVCQSANSFRTQWLTGGLASTTTGTASTTTTTTTGGIGAIPWNQQLNCFNSDCKLPKIWNGYSNACEDARDCTQPINPLYGSVGAVGGGIIQSPNVNQGLVLADHNQCIYPPCERGQDRDWISGTCVAYGNFQKCPNSLNWVADLKSCDLYFPLLTPSSSSSGGSR